jgi:hypothetical protein
MHAMHVNLYLPPALALALSFSPSAVPAPHARRSERPAREQGRARERVGPVRGARLRRRRGRRGEPAGPGGRAGAAALPARGPPRPCLPPSRSSLPACQCRSRLPACVLTFQPARLLINLSPPRIPLVARVLRRLSPPPPLPFSPSAGPAGGERRQVAPGPALPGRQRERRRPQHLEAHQPLRGSRIPCAGGAEGTAAAPCVWVSCALVRARAHLCACARARACACAYLYGAQRRTLCRFPALPHEGTAAKLCALLPSAAGHACSVATVATERPLDHGGRGTIRGARPARGPARGPARRPSARTPGPASDTPPSHPRSPPARWPSAAAIRPPPAPGDGALRRRLGCEGGPPASGVASARAAFGEALEPPARPAAEARSSTA